jgi:hypothetical protein
MDAEDLYGYLFYHLTPLARAAVERGSTITTPGESDVFDVRY